MADPVSWTVIAITAASAVVGAVGAIQQGQAQANAANYNAQVAQQNATIAQQQAQQEAELQQREARKRIGAAHAGYGASGITMEGSPLDVLEASASNAELDKQTILYNGRIRALGYQNTATLDKYSASEALTSSYYDAFGALLSGGAKTAQYGQDLLGWGKQTQGAPATS